MAWRHRFDQSEVPDWDPSRQYSPKELELLAEGLLREDARKELCRTCDEAGDKEVEGEETGEYKIQMQKDKEGLPIVDEHGHALLIKFPEYKCTNGHQWYKGEGKVKGTRGKNPILFEEHIIQRNRRRILSSSGEIDPAIVQGLYNRCVDSETEALTRIGWRHYSELKIGHEIWCFVPSRKIEKSKYEWQPILDIYTNSIDEKIGVWNESEHGISAKFTNGHKWLTYEKIVQAFKVKYTNLDKNSTSSDDLVPKTSVLLGFSHLNVVVATPNKIPIEKYKGIVWCPTIPSGFWVAKRDNSVYITGNSHPQGRRVNDANSRRKSGSSYYS